MPRRPRARRWIDITAPICPSTRVYPGDVKVRLDAAGGARKAGRGRGRADGALHPHANSRPRVTALSMSAHAGTHIDAPNHVPGGRHGVETLPLDALIGPALVLDLRRGHRRARGTADIASLPRRVPPRLLLRGSPVLPPSTALALIGRGVRLVGTDGLSLDPIGSRDLPAHRLLLGAGVIVLEGLSLRGVRPGRYHLIALPLLIPGSDGAPARVVLRSGR